MASFIKKPGNKWQALVARKGIRKAATFRTKQEAKDWAARQEHLILEGVGQSSRLIFRDVLERYRLEVSPTKKGERWENIKIKNLQSDRIARIRISEITTTDLVDWRDRRLRQVKPGTVLREKALLTSVFTTARRDWGLIAVNPMSDVRGPMKPPARDRLPTEAEFEALALSAGEDLTTATARAYHAFLFSCETAMRAGEVVGLTWENVDLAQQVATLPETKNGTARHVPLSTRAMALLEALPAADPVFGLTSAQLERLWRKLRDRAGVEGLTYHDSRHYAVTHLAQKLAVLDLARMIGHRDIKQLMTYYNTSAAELAKKLG